MQQEQRNKIVEKIAKLLALANDPGATEAESRLAMSRAKNLMLQYGLSVSEVERQKASGTVFVNSWGYEQTNVDAYEVVAVVGKRTLELRPIAIESVQGETSMSDQVKPVPGAFVGEVFRKRATVASYGGTPDVYVSFEFGGCSKWDGERSYYRSWYA